MADLGNAAQRFSEREAGQQTVMYVLVLPRMLSSSATLTNAIWILDALRDLAAVMMRLKT